MAEARDRTAVQSLRVAYLSMFFAAAAVLFTADTRFDFFGAKKPHLIAGPPVRHIADKPVMASSPFIPAGVVPGPDSYGPEPERPEQPSAETCTYTNVSYENTGPGETLLMNAEFRVADHYKSMPRPMRYRYVVPDKAVGDDEVKTAYATSYRTGVPIPIMFSLKDYDPIVGILRYNLPTPIATPGGDQFTFLDVGILAPEAGGWTAKGTLTLNFANAPPLTYENVALDTIDCASR